MQSGAHLVKDDAKDVYTDTETTQFLNENFVNHYVEVDEGPDIKLFFNIHVLPTLFILDSKGREVSRHEGALYHHDLMNFCNAALIKNIVKVNKE